MAGRDVRRPFPPGVVRQGLEWRVEQAVNEGGGVDSAEVELARLLADQIDTLAERLAADDSKPFDRQPLVGLAKTYAESLGRLFPREVPGGDPLADLVLSLSADADSQA